MSLATLLLAFLPAIVRPKLEPEKSDRERELEARVKELEEELDLARLERDSARRRLDEAWARVGVERIDARLERERLYQAAAYQQAMAAAQYQQQPPPGFGAVTPAMLEQLAAYQQGLSGELIDCTGGGRARHLTGILGAIGGA